MSKAIRQAAKAADSAVDAAKLREKWNRELLGEEGLSEQRADDLADGVDLLEERYPEILGLAVGEADDFARRKPDAKPLSDAADELGSDAASRSSKGKGQKGAGRKPRGGSSGRGGKGGRGRRGRRGRSGRGARIDRYSRRAYRETGIPGAAAGTTNFILSVFGMTVGLSLLYLLLSDAERAGRGKSAVEKISRGVSGAVQALILPVDPLGSTGMTGKGGAGDDRTRDHSAQSVTPTLRNDVQGPIQPRRRDPRHTFDIPHLGP